MKRKQGSAMVVLALVLCLSMSTQVFAHTTKANCNDLHVIENVKFEELIEEILKLQETHPALSNEALLNLVNEKMELRSGANRGVADIWNSLTDSEKKLLIRYPFDALKVNTAKDVATKQTELKFGYNGLGDRSDAFRHGIWNAKMAILIGTTRAEMFATAHEDRDITGTESDGYLKIAHKNMDLHNNALGRSIGETHLSADDNELSGVIYNSINQESSEFIWLHE